MLPRRRNRQKGNSLIETAMFMPLFILLLVGTYQIGRVTFLYYQVHKTLYGLARLLSTRQGVNLCDTGDAEYLNAVNLALSGAPEGGDPLINGLSADQISIRLERQEADSAILSECSCSDPVCNVSQGGSQPGFLVVSMVNGYVVNVSIPYLLTQTVTLQPTVRVPMGGL